jgi:hypothetical protein
MRVIQEPHVLSNLERPLVYLSGTELMPKENEAILKALQKCKGGSVLLPRTSNGDSLWRHQAVFGANLAVFWIPGGSPLQLLELGQHIGRYAVGFGAKRILIGANHECRYLDILEESTRAASQHFDGPWKLFVEKDFDTFLERIPDYVKASK